MSAPLPPVETVEDAMRHADEEIEALKRTKPSNAAEARVRSVEMLRLQQTLLEASRKVVAANAAKRISNGNGHASAIDPFLDDQILRALAEAIVPFVKQLIAEAVAEPVARIAELEARSLKYDGVWNETKAYVAGSFVTHAGSLWFCEDTNMGVRPGAGSTSWKLAVKRGRADK